MYTVERMVGIGWVIVVEGWPVAVFQSGILAQKAADVLNRLADAEGADHVPWRGEDEEEDE